MYSLQGVVVADGMGISIARLPECLSTIFAWQAVDLMLQAVMAMALHYELGM